jgi:transcriptional regulator GlxA family with amidase domain
VTILAYDGVDELDLVGVYAPLAKASQSRSPRFPIMPVVAGVKERVCGANGMEFMVTAGIEVRDTARAAVIPGGPGVHTLHENAAVSSWLAGLVARNVPLYTVCSGIFLLAQLDLIRERRVAVHAKKREALASLGVTNIGAGYVEDGNLHSIGGSSSASYVKAVEVSFRILHRFCPEAIPYVAERMETWPQTGWQGSVGERATVENGAGHD